MLNIADIDKLIDKTAQNVVKLLSGKNKKLATAESCTGGLISAAITSVSGSSEVFDLGICTYANGMKTKFVGVDEKTLQDFGAVSRETALLMAKGVMETAGSDIGISVTGIAGPTGGTPEKPVGTVYVGVCTKTLHKACLVFTDVSNIDAEHSREYVRKNTVLSALKLVESIINDGEC